MAHRVARQDCTSVRPSFWGSPARWSLHICFEDLKKFKEKHDNSSVGGRYAPSGELYYCDVDDNVYNRIVQSSYGVWVYERVASSADI